jgi:hypothetical protein
VEEDVHNPVEAVFDAPVGAHRVGELGGGELGRGEVVALGFGRLAVAIDLAFDHGDHGEAGKARLAGEAAAAGEPVDAVADAVAADLDAAVAAVGGFVALDGLVEVACEEQLHLLGERRPVALERKEIVGAFGGDGLGDVALAADGINGDERACELEPVEPATASWPSTRR